MINGLDIESQKGIYKDRLTTELELSAAPGGRWEMPLFKRHVKKEGRDDEEKPEGKEPLEGEEEEAPEGEEELEAPETEEEEAPEGPPGLDDVTEEELEREFGEDEEEDEDEPSIDELLEGFGEGEDVPGMPQPPIEKDSADLAGEDVQLIKMARKIVVIGDPAVGKTSLIKRYVQDVFDDRYLNTIGAKVMKKSVGVNRPDTGELVDLKLILWDIAGQESFQSVKKAYYRCASGAIVVCDITRRETMEDMHRWIENLFDVSDVIPMVLVINKIDLEDEAQFSMEDVVGEYAPYGSVVYTTSAKEGQNVELIFHELGKLITK